MPLSVSLWNDLDVQVFDGVGLAGFKNSVNEFLFAKSAVYFCLILFFLLLSSMGGVWVSGHSIPFFDLSIWYPVTVFNFFALCIWYPVTVFVFLQCVLGSCHIITFLALCVLYPVTVLPFSLCIWYPVHS